MFLFEIMSTFYSYIKMIFPKGGRALDKQIWWANQERSIWIMPRHIFLIIRFPLIINTFLIISERNERQVNRRREKAHQLSSPDHLSQIDRLNRICLLILFPYPPPSFYISSPFLNSIYRVTAFPLSGLRGGHSECHPAWLVNGWMDGCRGSESRTWESPTAQDTFIFTFLFV